MFSHKNKSWFLVCATLMLGMAGGASAAPAHYAPLNGNPDGSYTIDPQHTNVLFTIGHVGITEFTGHFDKISGTYTFNNTVPQKTGYASPSLPPVSIPTLRFATSTCAARSFLM